MPMVKRAIEPSNISQNHLDSEVKDELECVANNTLACIIQQLSSLSKHSEDLFGELYAETCTLVKRTANLSTRIERLKHKIIQLNPTVEEVLLQEINLRKPFKSSMCRDQQIMVRSTRPFCISEVYLCCESPPKLNDLDMFREDGKSSLKFYTDPNYFVELWYSEMKAAQQQQKKPKHKHGQVQKATNKPKALRTPKNKVEEFKDYRHGPEFVENFRKEHSFNEDGHHGMQFAHSYSHSELGVVSGPYGVENVSKDARVVTIGKLLDDQEKNSAISTRSNSIAQISSPRPSGPPPAPPVAKKQPPGHIEVNQQPSIPCPYTSDDVIHSKENEPDITSLGNKSGSAISSNTQNFHQHDESFSSVNNLPPPPPSPNRLDGYSVERAHRLPSPPAIPLSPLANESDHQLSPPPPPLPDSLLDRVFNPLPLKEPNDAGPVDMEQPSPLRNSPGHLHWPDQESQASTSSCSTLANESAKSGQANNKGPLVRDTRSDLLAAIKEGIQLRKVEENRLKSEQNKKASTLDVQSIMEAAFEMRRKALEENESDEEEDEEDEANWSD